MSTSEKWTNTYSRCPCGSGRILQHVDSPDNPWSRTTRTYELDCETCMEVWVLRGKELRKRGADEAGSQGYSRKSDLERDLKKIGTVAVDRILDAASLSTAKEEYRFLKEARICTEGPIRYKRAREGGAPAVSMCNPLLNIDWIVARLPDRILAAKIEELVAEGKKCELQIRNANHEMNAISIDSLLDPAP